MRRAQRAVEVIAGLTLFYGKVREVCHEIITEFTSRVPSRCDLLLPQGAEKRDPHALSRDMASRLRAR